MATEASKQALTVVGSPVFRLAAGSVTAITMKRHLITFLFLLLALALYSAGAAAPATFLLILGVVAEGIFWLRVSGKDKRHKKKVH